MAKKSKGKAPTQHNFVAKHANHVCRASVHRDKKNDYQRKSKHRNKNDAFFMRCA